MGRKAVAIGSVSGHASRISILSHRQEMMRKTFTLRMRRVSICSTQKPLTLILSLYMFIARLFSLLLLVECLLTN